jgi:hypothetical protein
MSSRAGAVHVVRVQRTHRLTDGTERTYASTYLRRAWRDGGKVKNETVANLSALPDATIEAIRASLAGEHLVPAASVATVTRSHPHGHVAAVCAMAKTLGLPSLLGPAGRWRDIAMALIVSRIVHPASKLATLAWWADVTLGADLGVADASTDETYAAMDDLLARQDDIQKALARKHLAPKANPSGMALYDLSSSWMEGTCCPLAARGYSRDGKKGKPQIEYGLLTDPEGRPVAINVLAGNTGDPTAFIGAVETVRDAFGLKNLVMVGDRGMITSARIDAIRETADNRLSWITALRAPAIRKLAADNGPLQMSLFDEQNFAEITSDEFPGERLIACRNPALAEMRDHKRQILLQATEKALETTVTAVQAGRLAGADAIGLKVGKLIGKYKMAKHFHVTITDHTLAIARDQVSIAAEAALDGIYVIRTPLPAERLDTAGAIAAYKNLAHVERAFRHIKIDDLDLRPIRHRLAARVRAHVFIAMLAEYVNWHLRKAWAPLTYNDQTPPLRTDPVAPATRSAAANKKASTHTTDTGERAHSYQGLLAHLATLTRNDIRYGETGPVIPTLTEPTDTQRRAFELIGHPIPLTLK